MPASDADTVADGAAADLIDHLLQGGPCRPRRRPKSPGSSPQPCARCSPPPANFLFDGGLLGTGPGQQDIHLQDGELTGWTMAAPGQWEELLAPHMARRVRACAADSSRPHRGGPAPACPRHPAP